MMTRNMIDKANEVDLLTLVGGDLTKVASTQGGEYAGSCPFCGGQDRFHVQPVRGRWFCRHCTEGTWKDAIEFVKRRNGASFPEAVAHLTNGVVDTPMTKAQSIALSHPTQPPSPAWQKTALAFVTQCQERLWAGEGASARRSLQKRGFSDETIRQARLGWNDQTRYDDRSTWDLPAELNDRGKPKRVWLPRGWALPSFIDGELWRVSIRRPKTDIEAEIREGKPHTPKYIQVSGSGNALHNADALYPGCWAVIVEGVFDALSIQQNAGDLVVPVATSSTTGCRSTKWIARLALAETVLVAYDADEAGQAAADYWLKVLPKAKRWRPWWADANRMAMDGVDLRNWLFPALPTNLLKPAQSDDAIVAAHSRLSELLARAELTPSEARELREVADLLGVKVRLESYDLNDPSRGWHELNHEGKR